MEDQKIRQVLHAHRLKHAMAENYGKAQVVQDVIEALGLYIPNDECCHDWVFDVKYNGYCPQPKQCTICGYYDYNGYSGKKLWQP